MYPISIEGKNFPDVWEQALDACWYYGSKIKTDYDKEEDPPSRDVTAMLVVRSPDSEPKYHRAAFPMGLQDLFDYIDEVVDGTRDHLIDKLGYTYHNRMVRYGEDNINQLIYVINELNRAEFSRRAQTIIWNPEVDVKSPGEDVPCLQRLWFRVIEGKLNMNVHMRSNDLFKATFSNMIAFYNIQKLIADRLDVPIGSYCHIADSLHIYGSYFEEVEQTLKSFKDRTWEERTWTSKQIKKYIFEGDFMKTRKTVKFSEEVECSIDGKEKEECVLSNNVRHICDNCLTKNNKKFKEDYLIDEFGRKVNCISPDEWEGAKDEESH